MNLKMIQKEATSLMSHYYLDTWSFRFDKTKSCVAYCDFDTKTIGLSVPYNEIRSYANVRTTILHEIAHALAGREHDHSDFWKNICISIGGTGEVYSNDVSPLPLTRPGLNSWSGVCLVCSRLYGARRPLKEHCFSCQGDLSKILWWSNVCVVGPK